MDLNIILGNNIDTVIWINNLKENKANHIIVIDYDFDVELYDKKGIYFMSPRLAEEYIKKFKRVKFYKSMYAYPGMQGIMSSLYK